VLAQPTKFADGEEAVQVEPETLDALPASRVALDKMSVHSLRKYAKTYDLPSVHPQSSKEELLAAVKRHWDGAKIGEEAVVSSLMRLRQRGSY
jgi:hypothetical protein